MTASSQSARGKLSLLVVAHELEDLSTTRRTCGCRRYTFYADLTISRAAVPSEQ